jgi:hypothetical protein
VNFEHSALYVATMAGRELPSVTQLPWMAQCLNGSMAVHLSLCCKLQPHSHAASFSDLRALVGHKHAHRTGRHKHAHRTGRQNLCLFCLCLCLGVFSAIALSCCGRWGLTMIKSEILLMAAK